MRSVFLLSIAALIVGCAAKEETPATEPATTSASAADSTGVAPMTSGAAGGLTPVTGAENVGGGSGGGVGQAAKEMARRAAGTPTAPVVPSDD